MTCTHSLTVPGRWVDNPNHNPEEWAVGGFDLGPNQWEDGYEEGTYKDIGIHNYACTQCSKVFAYPAKGKEFADRSNKVREC